MKEKIKKFFRRIGFMLAYGMKGADDEILSQNTDVADIGVVQTKEIKNLGEALLKGQVTQEVQELRYRDYRVSEASRGYTYLGNGQAIKTAEEIDNSKKKEYWFSQNNQRVVESVGHELERVGQYGQERYTFEIVYSDIVKFKIEPYATFGKFTVNDKNILVEFYFDKSTKDRFDPTSYMVMNEIERISKFTSSYQIENNDLCTNTKILNFITYKAKNEKDLVQYTIKDMNFASCEENNFYYILRFTSDNFMRVDLTEKFFSKTMADKYDKKEAKERTILFNPTERVERCDICGKEMNVYDADITKYEFGKKICQDCLRTIDLTKL